MGVIIPKSFDGILGPTKFVEMILFFRATFSYYEAIFNDEVSDYVRPNLVCDLHTSVLSTCPALAPTTCFSDDLLQKMNFWMFVEKSNIPEIFSYEAETCQAVKYVA